MPRLKEETSLKIISAQVPERDVDRLRERAVRNDRTLSQEVRRIIRLSLNAEGRRAA